MLAKLAEELPAGGGFCTNPNGMVSRHRVSQRIGTSSFRVAICPARRYFPEVHAALLVQLTAGCIVDGEIVIATPQGRLWTPCSSGLHPAASRVAKLAERPRPRSSRSDVIAVEGRDVPTSHRPSFASSSNGPLAKSKAPVHVTPMTPDPAIAREWLSRFEGAGLDGVIAKPSREGIAWQCAPDQGEARANRRRRRGGLSCTRMKKTSWSLVVARSVRDRGTLHQSAWTSAFTMAKRKQLALELTRFASTPSTDILACMGRLMCSESTRMPGGQAGGARQGHFWEPLRIERVCEVKYDHLQGNRFRHATVFCDGVADKEPERLPLRSARGHDPYELEKVLGS